MLEIDWSSTSFPNSQALSYDMIHYLYYIKTLGSYHECHITTRDVSQQKSIAT